MQDPVQIACRREVTPERLLEDDPAVLRAAGGAQISHHHRKETRRNRQVGDRPLGRGELDAQGGKGRRVVVVAVDVAQVGREVGEARFDETAILGDARAGMLDELFACPAGRAPPRP